MAADNFEHCLALTLQFEGGYVDNPHDPGGATNLGITRAVLAQVRGRPVARSEVMALSREEARGIYRRLYWNTIAGDALPKGVDAVLFDLSVNSGPQHAIHALQTALGQPLSGRVDNPTLSALAKCVPATLVTAICRQRLSFLARLKTFSFFGRGWSRRVQSIERAGLAMLADVPVAKPAPPKAVPNPPGQGIHPKGKPVDTNIPANTEVSKPFWASQTIWSSFGVIGSSLAGVVLAWKGGDINAFGASLTAMLGGVSAIVGRYRARTKIA